MQTAVQPTKSGPQETDRFQSMHSSRKQKSRLFPRETRRERVQRLDQIEIAFMDGLILENPTLANIAKREAREWFRERLNRYMMERLAVEGIQIPAGEYWLPWV